jgi:radical SAM superfamily enzyme YgiQ (UPF0313 family)
MRIYLADLGHNLLTRSSDVYPLGIANVASYLRAHLEHGGEPVQISLFREPQDLKAALDREAPEVLGLSNYAWNEELSHHFATYAKRRDPRTLTAMGGPNYPLVDEVRRSFLEPLRSIDVYVDGPTYEGERAFLNLIARWLAVGRSIEGVREAPLAGSHWIDRESGELVKGPEVERIRDLDEIPSPYLGGWLDPFLGTGYHPMLQIARGCPFSCTFCNSGVASNNRIYAHSVQNVKDDLLYLAERVKPGTTLCFADDNFGMYERDEEIADYIGWLQDHYDWPRYIRTTTGKNKGERIIRVMRKARGALPMTAAVQSMNPQVLKNIKRDNIKLETYRQIQEELASSGMQAYGELILGLPGETKESLMRGVEQLLDAGSKRISMHQLMLLHGAELSNPDSREKFRFDTRFRVVALDIGNYTGEPIVEVEEMVVATPSFSFQDYLDSRIFHLLLTIYYYEGNYDEAFAFARLQGVKPFDLIVRMQELLELAPAAFRKVIDDFRLESQQDVFDSREACLEWSRAHYAELVDGTVGGNLLSKYSMLGRFFATEASLDFLELGIARASTEKTGGCDREQLSTIMGYLRAVVLHAPFGETMSRRAKWTTSHDVEAWAQEGYKQPLSAYALAAPRTLEATTSPELKALIEGKLATFGEHPSGMGKFTRTVFARDLRRSFARTRPRRGEPVPSST